MNRKEIVQALEEKRVTGKGDRDEEIPDFEELQMDCIQVGMFDFYC